MAPQSVVVAIGRELKLRLQRAATCGALGAAFTPCTIRVATAYARAFDVVHITVLGLSRPDGGDTTALAPVEQLVRAHLAADGKPIKVVVRADGWPADTGITWYSNDPAPKDTAEPRYLTSVGVARKLGVTPTTVANWLARWPHTHPTLGVPAPDAWLDGERPVPLWLADSSAPRWEAWRTARSNALTAQRTNSPREDT